MNEENIYGKENHFIAFNHVRRFGESRKSISELEAVGMDTLHIDVIDGSFSPSMPLGIETIKRMREITSMAFDVHIMSNDNEFLLMRC